MNDDIPELADYLKQGRDQSARDVDLIEESTRRMLTAIATKSGCTLSALSDDAIDQVMASPVGKHWCSTLLPGMRLRLSTIKGRHKS